MQNKIIPAVEEHVFERPIPGQSLTNSPEDAQPWEKAPENTTVREATQKIFLSLLEEENLKAVTNLMADGTPIEEVTKVLLMSGYEKGKYNPDLMLQLIEPTMYILLAIAERVGIRPVLDRPGEEDDEPADEFNAEENRKADVDVKRSIGAGGRFQDAIVPSVSTAAGNAPAGLGPNLKEKLAGLDVSKVKENILQNQRPQAPAAQESLLSKPGV